MVISTGKGAHVGNFAAWDGGCLLIGSAASVVPVHAHYAIQIALGSVPGIAFRSGDDGPWTEYDTAIIPSRLPHSMDSTRVAPNAVLLIEPETREGRAIAERYLGNGIAAVAGSVLASAGPALFSTWAERGSLTAVTEAAQRVVRELSGGVAPSVVSDERVLRALAYIRSHLDGRLTLDEVAAEACLSPSRFRHLFVEQTGMGLQPYILWRRMLHVWSLLPLGGSLTAAAYEAGFADAAHLSRTSRAMFGFPPSAIHFVGTLTADTERPATR